LNIEPIISEDYVVLDEEATVSEMIGALRKFEKRAGLVFRNKKYLGLVEKKKLLKSIIDASKTKLKHFVQKSPLIETDADIIETAYLMYQSNVDYLPVIENKKIIGVISSLELAKIAVRLPEIKGTKINDLKLLKPSKVNKNDPLSTATTVMYKQRVDQVPIYDQGKIYGILSFRDLLRRYINWSPKRDVSGKFNQIASSRGAESEMPHLASLPVDDFSTNDNLVMVDFNRSLVEAVDLMGENRISDILVMEDEKFMGMLTVKNVLRKVGSLKIPKNYNIQFIGLKETKLWPHQKYNLKKIVANEAYKIQRMIHNEMNLVIHLKESEKGGRQQFFVNLRVESPGKMISVTQDDWDLETALRKTLENVKNKLKKQFRKDHPMEREYE